MKEFKVIATFPEGDQLELTVYAENVNRTSGPAVYFFKEKHLATWWYKDLCQIV
jgi:hypothetical protein